jgi:singapore isolate B (sub-type 7) whole genome shotgun sequence assembly, scaffold_14
VILAVISAEGCFRPEMAVPDRVKTPQPKDYLSAEQLPKEFDPYSL